jgi:hypothetical protein
VVISGFFGDRVASAVAYIPLGKAEKKAAREGRFGHLIRCAANYFFEPSLLAAASAEVPAAGAAAGVAASFAASAAGAAGAAAGAGFGASLPQAMSARAARAARSVDLFMVDLSECSDGIELQMFAKTNDASLAFRAGRGADEK